MSLSIIEQFVEQLPNVTQTDSFGYKFFFYGPETKLPFVTTAASDNEYDNVSNLNREEVFRINIGVSKDTYNKLFPGNATEWDYTALNQFMPHPHYAAQRFICILNPEGDMLPETFKFIEEAYAIAKDRFNKKQASDVQDGASRTGQ